VGRSESDGKGRAFLFGSLCLVLSASVCAEELVAETRTLSGFHAVEAAVSGDLRLARMEEPKLVIEARADTLDRLATVVEDGVLRIYETSGSSWWRNSGPIRIQIGYRDLDSLNLSGSADVRTDALSAEQFHIGISGSSSVRIPRMKVAVMRVEVSGSGDLEVDGLEAERLEIEVSGSGDLTFSGRVREQYAMVRGSGTVDSSRLETSRAEVTVSGSGDADVWVTGKLEARISGSGNIEYRGGAELVSQVTGSGSLKANQ
jgi:hypothetical protein